MTRTVEQRAILAAADEIKRAERTYETVGPRCPYCLHLHQPDEPFYFDESTCEMECGRCEKTFAMRVYTSTSWTCQPAESAAE